MKYSKHSLGQNNKKQLVPIWAYKEGVFLTPQNYWIVRVKIKGENRWTTLSKHDSEAAAKLIYKSHIKLL